MFRDGKFRPQNIWTEEEWAGPCNEGQCEWLGWMIERAHKLESEWDRDRLREAWRLWAAGAGPMPEQPAP
jgi:hypothetical protein